MKQYIQSALDTDYYKIVMAFFLQRLGRLWEQCEWEFTDRTGSLRGLIFAKDMEEIATNLQHIQWGGGDVAFLEHKTPLPNNFLWSLPKLWEEQTVRFHIQENADGTPHVRWEGDRFKASLMEIYFLASVSELYSERCATKLMIRNIKQHCLYEQHYSQIESMIPAHGHCGFLVDEFGTRRRYSYDLQEETIKRYRHPHPATKNFALANNPSFIKSTSNLHIANKLDIPFKGTMAHELLMPGHTLDCSQSEFMEEWELAFKGMDGFKAVLTDTFGLRAFLRELICGGHYRYFNTFRIDSGNPIKAGNMIINALKTVGVDPLRYRLYFSDGLNLHSALMLSEYFWNKIKTGIGMGTFLSNNVPFIDLYGRPNFVAKMVSLNRRGCVKLSDVCGKHVGIPDEIEVAKRVHKYNPIGE